MDRNLIQAEERYLAAEKMRPYEEAKPTEKLLRWRVCCLMTERAGGVQGDKKVERKTKKIL